jgi:hypothetical protein
MGKGCFGLEQDQARPYTAVLRHIGLVMAAFSVCAVTATALRDRTDVQPLQAPASSRSPSAKSGDCSPTRPPGRNRRATQAAGSSGDATTRHDPAGSTNTHACNEIMPWSASHYGLRY